MQISLERTREISSFCWKKLKNLGFLFEPPPSSESRGSVPHRWGSSKSRNLRSVSRTSFLGFRKELGSRRKCCKRYLLPAVHHGHAFEHKTHTEREDMTGILMKYTALWAFWMHFDKWWVSGPRNGGRHPHQRWIYKKRSRKSTN